MSCNYAKRALSRAALGARLLTPLKDNQQPNSPESWRAGWNLDHLPAVPEDKLPEINSRILENRGKTDGLRCLRSASRLDSPFRSLPIPPSLGWLLATAAPVSSLLEIGIGVSSRCIHSWYIRSASALPIRENCLVSTLSIILFIVAMFLAKQWYHSFPITGARKYIFLCFRVLILISENVY